MVLHWLSCLAMMMMERTNRRRSIKEILNSADVLFHGKLPLYLFFSVLSKFSCHPPLSVHQSFNSSAAQLTWATNDKTIYFKLSWFRRRCSQGWIENRVAPLFLIALNSPILRTVTERTQQFLFLQYCIPDRWWYRLAIVFFIQSQVNINYPRPGRQTETETLPWRLLLLFAWTTHQVSLCVLKAATI